MKSKKKPVFWRVDAADVLYKRFKEISEAKISTIAVTNFANRLAQKDGRGYVSSEDVEKAVDELLAEKARLEPLTAQAKYLHSMTPRSGCQVYTLRSIMGDRYPDAINRLVHAALVRVEGGVVYRTKEYPQEEKGGS